MLVVGCGYPIQFHPGRYYIDTLCFGSKPANWHPVLRHCSVSVFIIFITFTISFFVRRLDFVLGLVGATGSTLMVYILPGLFYYKAFSNKSFKEDRFRPFALALAIAGFFIMVICVTFIILNYTIFDD